MCVRTGIVNSWLVLLMILCPPSVWAQKNDKPLPTKQNPLRVGKRDINNNQINFYSLRDETALGEQYAMQVEWQLPIMNDPVITEYVNRLGQNLALNSDLKVPLTIKVVVSDEINAFALPGGFLYVNLGVLRAAESESEVAGVMAHEIAHAAARHAMENMSKQGLISLAAIPLIFVGGPAGELGRTGADLGLASLFFKFSRGAEKEADELAAQYLWASGYDPWSLTSFFQKLQREERTIRVSSLFRTHPTTPDRIRALQKLIPRFPPKENLIVSTPEFDQIKNRLGGVGYRPHYAGRGTSDGKNPPVLRRRGQDDPSDATGDDVYSTAPSPTSTPTTGPQPPVLHRRTSDEARTDNASATPTPASSTGDAQQPPILYRRTTTDSSTGTSESTNTDGKRPPTLMRRTIPSGEPDPSTSSIENSTERTVEPVITLGRPPIPPRVAKPLERTPPTLRRRY